MYLTQAKSWLEAGLLHWGVIAPPRPHPKGLPVAGNNLKRAKVPVWLEVRRLVRHRILAAQFLLNLGKCIRHVANLEGKKRPSSSCIGNALQHLVARSLGAAHVRTDRVHD